MPEFSSHAPGTFCWPELATTDQKAASRSTARCWDGMSSSSRLDRRDLLDVHAARTGGGGRTMRRRNGSWRAAPLERVRGGRRRDVGEARAGAWGKVLAPAFDVMDAGRMAVLQDPRRGDFVWQAKRHIGPRFFASRVRSAGPSCSRTTRRPPRRSTRSSSAGGEGQPVHRVQRRLDAGCRHDEDRPEVGQRAAALDAVLPGHDCDAPRRATAGGRHVPPNDIPNVGGSRCWPIRRRHVRGDQDHQ